MALWADLFPDEDVRKVRGALWPALLRALETVPEDQLARVAARFVFRRPEARADPNRARQLLWALSQDVESLRVALAAALAREPKTPWRRPAFGAQEPLPGAVRFAFMPDPATLSFWVPEGLPHRRRLDGAVSGRIAISSGYYRQCRERWAAWVARVREEAVAAGVWPVQLPYLAPAAILCVVPARERDLDNGLAKPLCDALWRNGLLPDDGVRAVPWLLVHASRRLAKGTAVAVTRLGENASDPVAALTAGLAALEAEPDLRRLLDLVEAVLPPAERGRKGST